MEQDKKNVVYLSNEEAEIWKWCFKHYNILKVIMNIRPGKVILNLDCNANIKPEFNFFNPENINKIFENKNGG